MGRDIEAVVEHAEHFLALGGEKSVCLGADLDGIDELPKGFGGRGRTKYMRPCSAEITTIWCRTSSITICWECLKGAMNIQILEKQML